MYNCKYFIITQWGWLKGSVLSATGLVTLMRGESQWKRNSLGVECGQSLGPFPTASLLLVALPAARIPQSPGHWDLTVRGTQSWEDVLMTPLATWGGIFSPRVSTESLKSLESVEAKSGRPAENLIRHSLPVRPVFAFTSFNSKLLLAHVHKPSIFYYYLSSINWKVRLLTPHSSHIFQRQPF